MAEIFNNRICVFANELIIFNPKTQVGSEDGFIPEGTYYSMVRNGQLIVLRRGIPGCPALVDFETMRKDVKKGYINTEIHTGRCDCLQQCRLRVFQCEIPL
mgnify:CR=1 FL=1